MQKTPTQLVTGASVAFDIQLQSNSIDTKSPARSGTSATDIARVDLRRQGAGATAEAGGEPRIRAVAPGHFFADNIEFSAPGAWDLRLHIREKDAVEIAVIPLTVTLNPAQLNQSVEHANSVVPDFSLTSSQGKAVTRADLLGNVWIAALFFATCPDICPLIGQKMAALQKHFQRHANIRFVSITTDPKNDTPAVLAAYAKRFKAKNGRWLFLTGDKESIVTLAKQGLKLDVKPDSPAHSNRFAVVDQKGLLRGAFDFSKFEEMEQLKIVVDELLKTGASGIDTHNGVGAGIDKP